MNRFARLAWVIVGPGLALALDSSNVQAEEAPSTHTAAGQPPEQTIGRPVRVASLSFPNNKTLEQIVSLVDREGARGADLITLPETCRGNEAEPMDGPTVTAMRELARKHRAYVVCPIYRRDGAKRYNSALLIDRSGRVVCVYDKVYPYWSEFDLNPTTEVGREAPVHEADFGRVGMAICFDANFPEVWKRLADQGAELVVWPSAYSAGTTLQAHALMNHFYIVTATLVGDCIVYDITGEEIHYSKSKDVNVARVTLDLDRGIYHQNFNIAKRDGLLKKYGKAIVQEKWMDREQWFVLKATKPDVSARALARQEGLEELRDYVNRSRREIDAMRGWPFAKKTLPGSD